MQAQAEKFSGYAGKFLCFFEGRILKQFVSIHLFLKQAQHHIPSQPGSA